MYYKPENPLDLIALNHLASELDDKHRGNLITPIGEWGKWINGGGWLQIEGVPVDFLSRDLAQVSRVIDDCQAGQITMDYQPGHPPDAIAILAGIEQDLSQWYGDRRIVM